MKNLLTPAVHLLRPRCSAAARRCRRRSRWARPPADAWMGRPLEMTVPARFAVRRSGDECVHADVFYGDDAACRRDRVRATVVGTDAAEAGARRGRRGRQRAGGHRVGARRLPQHRSRATTPCCRKCPPRRWSRRWPARRRLAAAAPVAAAPCAGGRTAPVAAPRARAGRARRWPAGPTTPRRAARAACARARGEACRRVPACGWNRSSWSSRPCCA